MVSAMSGLVIRQVLFDDEGKIAAVSWSCGCSWSRLVQVACEAHAGRSVST